VQPAGVGCGRDFRAYRRNKWPVNQCGPSRCLCRTHTLSRPCAAVIMSLIQSAKLCGHEPYRYLRDVLDRLPTQPASRLAELLPHCWQPMPATTTRPN
jgi:hypothetical protein